MATKLQRPKPSTRSPERRLVLLVFEQAQMLDIAGPADVFAMARRLDPKQRYSLVCVSAQGGPVTLSNGLILQTQAALSLSPRGIDSLIVAGAEREGLLQAMGDAALSAWVQQVAAQARRVVSVCVASFALAHWGLLEGRRATSHWSVVDLMQKRFANVQVDKTALFVQDGKLWTAGGVTTGIDMSLAMVEADSSRLLAGQVARALVMSQRRVGNQSQYSTQLRAQTGRYTDLVEWMCAHLDQTLDISSLAAQACESERSFCRRFSAEVGETPGRFVEQLRLSAARRALEGGASAKAAAHAGGFASQEQLSRAFRRRLNMSPLDYRRQHLHT